ncbi:MAG: Peptidyl-prolyl cis-trans isomerase cyp8, partial [Bogoriella megaspora]
MGKGTDKLYITQAEWSSSDQYSASAGANVRKSNNDAGAFKRLPFNYCALSLQPFEQPVCTASGTIFDYERILRWLKEKGTNPVDGSPLKSGDLIKLTFAKNEDGEYVDPVTYKVFTDNTHITAIRHNDSANVFAFDTVQRLNIKAKNWRDLVSDEEFTRKDLITLQDPQNIASRNLSSFNHLKNGNGNQQQEAAATQGINTDAMGSSAKILRAKEAVARSRAERDAAKNLQNKTSSSQSQALSSSNKTDSSASSIKKTPYNAARHTTGQAAASFTSTGLTPHTSGERALLTDEEYMLVPRRIKHNGYCLLHTTHGSLNIELYTHYAPKAVWNFLRLAQQGYYNSIPFHRNIRNFMIQGGDPTGTGRGGQSIWAKNFADEVDNPLKFDTRGILAMANKGKNTNGSQFFVTYRAAQHLTRKHTIFGRVLLDDEGGRSRMTLKGLEEVKTGEGDRPEEECGIKEVVVLIDPFEEFLKEREDRERTERRREE